MEWSNLVETLKLIRMFSDGHDESAELKRRELKIQQLTLELAHHKRIRFGCKSEALSREQRDLFIEASDEDGAAIVTELEQQKPTVSPRQNKRSGRKSRAC